MNSLRHVLDHMDLTDLMEMIAHLVPIDHQDRLQDHKEIKEREGLEEKQENLGT